MPSNSTQNTYRTVIFRTSRLILLVAAAGMIGVTSIGIWALSVTHPAASPSEIAGEPIALFLVAYGIVATIALVMGVKNRLLELQLTRRDRKIVSRR